MARELITLLDLGLASPVGPNVADDLLGISVADDAGTVPSVADDLDVAPAVADDASG